LIKYAFHSNFYGFTRSFVCLQQSFGFDTAVQEAIKAIKSAHVEAKSCINGIGIVVLMGYVCLIICLVFECCIYDRFSRASGFIAVNSTLASGEVNICLIPEVPFVMDGPNGLLQALKERIKATCHCVIVVVCFSLIRCI
jgi:6-phosphofructokinase 1